MLSIGIITTTNITDVFLGFKYSFRQLWGRRNKEHLSFYDYQNSKKKDRKSTGGLATLIVGIMVVGAASIIAVIYVY